MPDNVQDKESSVNRKISFQEVFDKKSWGTNWDKDQTELSASGKRAF